MNLLDVQNKNLQRYFNVQLINHESLRKFRKEEYFSLHKRILNV
jgi:hypothetical protein